MSVQGPDDLGPALGANLRRLRKQRGLSLERLAQASGVSRAMLGQIENSQSTPTITVLWKVARALDVALTALISPGPVTGPVVLRHGDAKVLSSLDGTFTSRALFPFDGARRVEFYEVRVAAGAREDAAAHAVGTTEYVAVHAGRLELIVDGVAFALEAGDAISFDADVPHAYTNVGDGVAVLYMVVCHSETLG